MLAKEELVKELILLLLRSLKRTRRCTCENEHKKTTKCLKVERPTPVADF